MNRAVIISLSWIFLGLAIALFAHRQDEAGLACVLFTAGCSVISVVIEGCRIASIKKEKKAIGFAFVPLVLGVLPLALIGFGVWIMISGLRTYYGHH